MTGEFLSFSDLWRNYWKMTGPKNASDTQRREMRRAYCAGILTMLLLMERIGQPDCDEKKAFDYLSRLKRDVETFFQLVCKNEDKD